MKTRLLLCCSALLVACAGSPSLPDSGSAFPEAPADAYSAIRTESGEILYFTPRGLVDENGFRVNLDGSPATGATNAPNRF